jgi:hypothetical protein
MKKAKFDFGGYATKNGLKCTDGRVILKDAFKDNDGQTVPLVWQHQHNEPSNVLGHAVLENRDDGVYAYCTFNESESGKNGKILVQHGDVGYLSIYANQLVEKAKNVIHGMIREVSLVMAGANPGAVIDNLAFEHSDGSVTTDEEEAIIYTGLELEKKEEPEPEPDPEPKPDKIIKHADDENKTLKDVFDTLSEEQKTAVYAVVNAVLEGDEEGGDEGDNTAEHSDDLEDNSNNEGDKGIMKNNVFDGSAGSNRVYLSHDQFKEITDDAFKYGSLKQSIIAHAGTYGIDNIDYLFPDARLVEGQPVFLKRETTWVAPVISGTRHTPFSRIKSVYADITVDTARAMGYVTGALKKDEVFGLLKRTTNPTTIYKKQKLDRNDILDITDLDVVAWLKAEMRVMLDEEIARAVLVGDGRLLASEDKIDETCIRPIWTDSDLYAHHLQLASTDDLPEEVMDKVIEGRVNYKGSGTPTLFTSPTFLTSMLLIKDTTGRRIYSNLADLAAALRVSSIIEVPIMEGLHRTDTVEYDLLGIMVNLFDYTIGADKGGQVSMFDDFDIDYNQYKYLIETRISGALTMPKGALVIERAQV